MSESKVVFRGALVVGTVLLVAAAVGVRLALDLNSPAPRSTHYLPVADPDLEGTLSMVSRDKDRCAHLTVPSSGLDQVACDGEILSLSPLRLRVRSSKDGVSLELVGATLDQGVIGGGRDADAILRLPGVGAYHARVLPGSACGSQGHCVQSLLGEARTRVQGPGALRPRAVGRGETVAVSSGDTLWLGLSPFRVTEEPGGLSLTLEEDYASFGGRRGWIGDPAPRWGMDGNSPWKIRSERTLFSWRQLALTRVARQWEEEVQRLVDENLLCLQRGVPGTQSPPEIVWRDTSKGTCVDGSDDGLAPLSSTTEGLLTRYRHNKTLLRILEGTNRRLAEGDYVASPETLHFSFDWRDVQTRATRDWRTVSGDMESEVGGGTTPMVRTADESLITLPVPTQLLGIWWGMSEEGVPQVEEPPKGSHRSPQLGGSPLAQIRVRPGSTSPQLRVTHGVGALRAGDLLLLGANRSDGDATLVGEICLEQGVPASNRRPSPFRRVGDKLPLDARSTQVSFYGTALPLGRLTLWSDDPMHVGLEPLAAPSGGCMQVRLQDGAASWRSDGEKWLDLVPGASFGWKDLRFVYRDTGDVAAVTERDPNGRDLARVFPFEADAGQLVGRGFRHWSGLEASIAESTLDQYKDQPIDLTLHGDLQRLVHRALATTMEASALADPRPVHLVRGTLRGSAVLLDANTGAVLAAATWPPFDPNRPAEEEVQEASRARMNGQSFDPAENLAFNRNAAAGSTYKLATSIAMARAGLLDPTPGSPQPGTSCGLGARLYTWSRIRKGGVEQWSLVPKAVPTKGGVSKGHFSCLSDHASIPSQDGRARDTFLEAFAGSCNVYFGLAGLSLLDASIPFGGPVQRAMGMDLPDRGLGQGPLLFRSPPASALGFVWPRGLDLASAVLPPQDLWDGHAGNRLFSTFLLLGHRFFYPTDQGVVRQQGDKEWAPGRAYATWDQPWLPGLVPGQGFRYPEVPGPASFASTAWPDGQAPGADWLDGRLSNVPVTRETRTLAILPWGQDVQASALSLAVMAAVPASIDASIVSPYLLLRSDVGRRVLHKGVLTGEQQGLLRAAMQRVMGYRRTEAGVVATGTGTAYFASLGGRRDRILERVGGKTGTITIQVPAVSAPGEELDRLRRIRYYACGIYAVADQGGLEPPPLERGDRQWLQDSLKRGEVPPVGFATGTEPCLALTPGRVPAQAGPDPDPDVAQIWVNAYKKARYDDTGDMAESSAFVAGVFKDLVAADGDIPVESRALATGQGLALAVVADHHPRAAKDAAAAILNDLDIYYEVRGGALPRPRKEGGTP